MIKGNNTFVTYLNLLGVTHTIVFRPILQRTPAQKQFVRAVEDTIGLRYSQCRNTH